MTRSALFSCLMLWTCLSTSAKAQERTVLQLGAAIPGRTFQLQLHSRYSAAGRAFVLAASAHTEQQVAMPPFVGMVGLDLNNLWAILFGTFPKYDPNLTFGIKVPNLPALLGLTVDLQFVDDGGVPPYLSEETVVTVIPGVGTALFAQGHPNTAVGFEFNRAQNTTVGMPQKQNATKYGNEVCRIMPRPGWSQGFFATFRNTDLQIDPRIHKRDVPVRDLANPIFGSIALPGGRRFMPVRDLGKAKDWLLVLIDDNTGTVAEIAGTRVTNVHPTLGTYSPFEDWFAVRQDGKVALVVVGYADTASAALTPPLRDKIWLVKLDGTTWSNNSPVFDVTPSQSFAPVFDAWGSSLMPMADGVLYRGRRDKGSAFFVPWDGSYGSVQVELEKTGVNKDPTWIWFDSYRMSADGRTVIMSTGSGPSSSNGWLDELEVYGLANVTTSSMAPQGGSNAELSKRKMLNLTRFQKSTSLEADFGAARGNAPSFNAALSPSAGLAAVIGGYRSVSPPRPNVLYVMPTDGSLGGNVKKLGTFPFGANELGTPHFLNDTTLLIFAGKTGSAMDLFRVDLKITRDSQNTITSITESQTTNLTNVGNIDCHWTLVSDNGKYFYFGRGYTDFSVRPEIDIVRVDQNAKVGSISGSEFGGSAVSLEMAPFASMYRNEFRLAPNSSNHIYFVARPARTGNGKTFHDMNVYRFDFENGGGLQQVSNYSGSATTQSSTVHIEGLQVLSDGSVVFAKSATAGGKEAVTFLSSQASAKPVEIGRFAKGRLVADGSVRVQEGAGGVYWVQSDDGAVINSRGYFASFDDRLKGHPVQMTGLIRDASEGYVLSLAVGSTQN